MKAKTLLLVVAMVAALPLAAQENQLSAPIKILGAKQVERNCNSQLDNKPTLSRGDMQRGFGRAMTDEMETLRLHTNEQAHQICLDGGEVVTFTFVRGNGDRSMAITAGKAPVLAAASH